MTIKETLKRWWRQLRGKDLPKAIVVSTPAKSEDHFTELWKKRLGHHIEGEREKVLTEYTEQEHRVVHGYPGRCTIRVPQPGSKVGGIGRHMKKHGKQSKEYRKSVLAKKKVEDED